MAVEEEDDDEALGYSPYEHKRISMDNLMKTPEVDSRQNSQIKARRIQPHLEHDIDIVKRIDEISYKVDQLSDSIEHDKHAGTSLHV